MKEAPVIVVVVVFAAGQPPKAQPRVVSDSEAEPLCQRARADLDQIGIVTVTMSKGPHTRSARRRAFADPAVQALVACQSKPLRIEVFYPDGSRLGDAAFVVPVLENDPSASVYVSERIRSERFVADVPKPVTLDVIKLDPKLKDMVLVKNSRLSVQPVTAEEFKHICKLGGVKA